MSTLTGDSLPPDNHVHTEWSWDTSSQASMTGSCEKAIALGIPAVAFTDHLDFSEGGDGDRVRAEGLDPHRYDRMRLTDIDGYLAAIDDCRRRYPDLRILSGAEIGEAHLFGASAARVAARAGFDRVLGSVHAIPLGGRLTASEVLFSRLPPDEVMARYFAEVVRLIDGSDQFEVLAHLDFPRRMWPAAAGPYEEKRFEQEYRAVLNALAATGRVLEVNTKSPLASVELLRWWREAGGKAISFGSDAHQPWRVGDRFRIAVDVADAAGFGPGRDPFGFWILTRLPCRQTNKNCWPSREVTASSSTGLRREGSPVRSTCPGWQGSMLRSPRPECDGSGSGRHTATRNSRSHGHEARAVPPSAPSGSRRCAGGAAPRTRHRYQHCRRREDRLQGC